MVVELNINHNRTTNNNATNASLTNGKINDQQLAEIKTSLLAPNEVTFCVKDEDSCKNGVLISTPTRLKRYTESEISETDSIVSSLATTGSKKRPNIPDGGFGWVVVGSSFVVSLIADGISFSFGLIYTELLHNFQTSPSKLAWVGSLFLAVPLLSGPIMSNLVDKYGCRKMTMIGGFVSCLGFVLASFSDSVELLYLTFGILAGIGLGVGYVTAVVSIAFWFDKKRTFATGIGASGTGLGTFIFAPLTQWLIETYGWRGATLILAGCLLNFTACGALMRDPDWLIEENMLESRSESVQTFSPQASNLCLDEIKKLIETGAPKEDILDTLVTNYNTEANQNIHISDIVTAKKYLSEVILPTYFNANEEFDSSTDRKYNSRRSLCQQVLSREHVTSSNTNNEIESEANDKHLEENKNCALASSETLDTWEKVPSRDKLSNKDENDAESMEHHYLTGHYTNTKVPYGSRYSLDETLILKPIERFKHDLDRNLRGASLDVVRENEIFTPRPLNENQNDVVINVPDFQLSDLRHRTAKRSKTVPVASLKYKPSLKYPNYFRNMRIHRNSIHYRGAMLNTHRYRLRASSCPNIYRNSMTTIARESEEKWYDDFLDIIKSIFDFSLFLDYKFAMMSSSTLVLFVWFIIPYFYITEHMLKFGYKEEDSARLISIIGIFNTIGMVGLGWLGDQPWVNVTRTYAFCLVICGISVVLIPVFVTNYAVLILLCILFGLTFASSFSFTPIILVRLVNLDDFTCAYGLILLVQGIGSLIGPPLAGCIFDYTNRWDDSFYAAGVFIAISGILSWLIGPLRVEEDVDD